MFWMMCVCVCACVCLSLLVLRKDNFYILFNGMYITAACKQPQMEQMEQSKRTINSIQRHCVTHKRNTKNTAIS